MHADHFKGDRSVKSGKGKRMGLDNDVIFNDDDFRISLGLDVRVISKKAAVTNSSLSFRAQFSAWEASDTNYKCIHDKTIVTANGIYDTGSHVSAISPALAQQIGSVETDSAHLDGVGTRDLPTPIHCINILFYPDTIFHRRKVHVVDMYDEHDFRIGMDIIGLGDFSIKTYRNFKLIQFIVQKTRPIHT